jgi:hypothetical protein
MIHRNGRSPSHKAIKKGKNQKRKGQQRPFHRIWGIVMTFFHKYVPQKEVSKDAIRRHILTEFPHAHDSLIGRVFQRLLEKGRILKITKNQHEFYKLGEGVTSVA